MSDIVETFILRKDQWLIALYTHLQISILALLLSIVIAIPIAIVITKRKKLSQMVLQIAGIFQTVPSLAILGLLIPFFGIGKIPAVIALVIYAIFPIMQNTVTALEEIDPSLIEAAEAFGMNKIEKLLKFELALAMPVIMSGVRTSAVMIIGTATLAALIGAGGLGSFILLGIDRNNSSLILIGALSSAFLALVINMIIRYFEKKSLKKIVLGLNGIIILLVLSYLPNNMMNKKLIIAGKLGSEPEIIINMYELLIEEYTDIEVEIKPNFGKTSFLYEALKSGAIDIYPEFTGTITSSLLKDMRNFMGSDNEVYKAAKDGIYMQDKLVLLKPMLFENTYALAMKKTFAAENNIKNISDLIKVVNDIKAGFTLEFNDREDGNLGLIKLYNLNLKAVTMEPSLRYQAINNNEVQLIDAYSTDSELMEYNLVVLKDDLNLFPSYQGAPLMKEATLKKYPQLKEVLEMLAGKISAEEMSAMNYDVKVNNKTAKDVAWDYLTGIGLIKPD